jgi:hypothetical protein
VVVALLAFVVTGVAAVAPADLGAVEDGDG